MTKNPDGSTDTITEIDYHTGKRGITTEDELVVCQSKGQDYSPFLPTPKFLGEWT